MRGGAARRAVAALLAAVAVALPAGCDGGDAGPSALVEVPVGTPAAVGAGPAGVFVAGYGDIVRIDPATNRAGPRVELQVRLPAGTEEIRRIYRDLLGRLGGLPPGANPPVPLAVGEAAAWWGRPGTDLLARSVPPLGRVRATIPLGPAGRSPLLLEGEGPVAAAVGAGGVWVVDDIAGTGRLTRIGATTDRVELRVELPATPTAVAAGEDMVVVADAGRELRAYDPRSGAPLDWRTRFAINLNDDVVIAGGAVWFVDGDEVSRADARDPRAARTIEVRGDAVALAAGAGAVWVAAWEGDGEGWVHRLDPAGGEVTRTFAMPGRPDDVAATSGAAWAIVCCGGPELARMDP